MLFCALVSKYFDLHYAKVDLHTCILFFYAYEILFFCVFTSDMSLLCLMLPTFTPSKSKLTLSFPFIPPCNNLHTDGLLSKQPHKTHCLQPQCPRLYTLMGTEVGYKRFSYNWAPQHFSPKSQRKHTS